MHSRSAATRGTIAFATLWVAAVGILTWADTPAAVASALQLRLDEVRTRIKAGDYKAADEQAETIVTSAAEYGADSLEMGEALALSAETRVRNGRAVDPETRARVERALAIEEGLLGAGDLKVANVLDWLGHVQRAALEHESARRSFERMLAIRERVLGPSHVDTARAHDRLACQLVYMGDYAGARVQYERALAILDADPNVDEVVLAIVLNNYAAMFNIMDDPARALEAQLRALPLLEKRLGPDHAEVVRLNENMAGAYGKLGRYDEAWRLYVRVLALRRSELGPEHPYVGATLSLMGNLKLRMGRPEEAIPLLRDTVALLEKTWGPDNEQVIQNVSALGEALTTSGRLTEARVLLERAAATWERLFNPDHPALAKILARLARCARAQNEPALAVSFALRAESVSRSYLGLLARTLPETQTLQFAATRTKSLGVALSVAADGLPEAQRLAVWDACIRTRGVVAEEMAARRQTFQVAAEPALAPLWNRFVSARQAWVDLIVRGTGKRPIEEHRTELAAARNASEMAEEALAGASLTFRRERASRALGLTDVRAALSEDSVLVGYVRYVRTGKPIDRAGARPPDAPAYLAFVMSREGSWTLPIGSAAAVERLVDHWRAEILRGADAKSPSEAASRHAGAALRRAVWDPVARHFGTARHVFVVPDGALSLISFGALPVASGQYLIEDRRLVHVLSSERDLALPETRASGTGLLALGDPAYDDVSPVAALSGPREPTVFRGPRPGCPDFQSVRFEPLAATRTEVASIVNVLREAGQPADRLAAHTGAAASEGTFKAQAPGRRILHLATHGFSLDGACGGADSTRGIGGLAPSAADTVPTEKDPLRLSGVALAGANHRGQAGAGEDDGIVTAEEIASLDLTGVEWAVLSACDTGVGALHPDEGVLGLPRALRVAGARTTILSLWPVDDVSTQRFMTSLYRARWALEHSTGEAMREAALSVLGTRRRAGQGGHPFYWAGFVAVGDWR